MFIYVFSEADRDAMSSAGFDFVCEYPDASVWVFLYDEAGKSALKDMTYLRTDKMCFSDGADHTKDGGGRNG